MNLFSNKPICKNSLVLLRIWCGIIFIYFGKSFIHPDKLHSFADWLKEMSIPFSLFLAYISKGTEFIGGFFLVIGFLTRPVCLLLAINMTVATFVANKGDLLENAQGSFLLLLIVLTIFLSGQGTLSVDNLVLKRKRKNVVGNR
jgi:putative oxidoreductase